MKEMGYSMSEESDFLRNLMFKSIPERLKKGELKKLIFMLICTMVIGIGYLHCFVWRRKIKICLISKQFYPKTIGGAEVYMYEIHKRIKKRTMYYNFDL